LSDPLPAAVRRALLVDDEDAILFAVGEFLRAHGLEVDTASTLESALDHLAAHAYSIVVADLRLSEGDDDGLEVVRQAGTTKVILLTAWASEDVEADAYRAGAVAVMEKPCDLRQLLNRINQLTGFTLDPAPPPNVPPEDWRRLPDCVDDRALFFVDPTGRIASWNTGARSLFGWHAEEVVGRELSSLAAGVRDIDWMERLLDVAARTDRTSRNGWIARKDDEPVRVRAIAVAMRDGSDAITTFAIVASVVPAPRGD
jgi:PAS domain S-box-containing protein